MDESTRKRKNGNFLLDDPPFPRYSYAGQGLIAEDDKELNRFVYYAVAGSGDDLYLRALRRGISWHHAGLSRKRRTLTEMLFRKKFVRVVIATGTLALGINMPCTTVVFGQDSIFLNAQQFQQMSGRAGRRGFDTEGNVVFFCGISERKIARLVTGSLPRMIGHMPIGIVKVLRLLLLAASKYEKIEYANDALNSALSMLSSPMLAHARPEMQPKLKLHFTFIIQYLLQEYLINEKGQLIGLAGLVSHLHYHEPYNLVLASFLQRGLFHELCSTYTGKERNEMIVIVLSYLFARYPLHSTILDKLKSRKERTWNSSILLPPLPANFRSGAMEFNLRAWNIFHAFIKSVASVEESRDQVSANREVILPVSEISFDQTPAENTIEGSLENLLQQNTRKNKACSPFAALSGNTDNKLISFDSPFSNIHHGLYMDVNFMPFLNLDIRLNGYALDFYKHGIWQSIMKENGLQESYVFQNLKDFLLALQAIVTSLEEIEEIKKKKGQSAEESDIVLAAMREVAEEFDQRFQKAFY